MPESIPDEQIKDCLLRHGTFLPDHIDGRAFHRLCDDVEVVHSFVRYSQRLFLLDSVCFQQFFKFRTFFVQHFIHRNSICSNMYKSLQIPLTVRVTTTAGIACFGLCGICHINEYNRLSRCSRVPLKEKRIGVFF